MRTYRVCLCGEVAVGKTTFLRAHQRLPFLRAYNPTVDALLETDDAPLLDDDDAALSDASETHWSVLPYSVSSGGAHVLLTDSSGLRDMRGDVHLPATAAEADVVVLCFSLLSQLSGDFN